MERPAEMKQLIWSLKKLNGRKLMSTGNDNLSVSMMLSFGVKNLDRV